MDKEICAVGERIKDLLAVFRREGMQTGELRPELAIMSTVFSCWGMLRQYRTRL